MKNIIQGDMTKVIQPILKLKLISEHSQMETKKKKGVTNPNHDYRGFKGSQMHPRVRKEVLIEGSTAQPTR